MKKIIPLILLAASLCLAVKVGILGDGYMSACPNSNKIYILLDVEDDNNQSGWFWGYPHALGVLFPSGHVMFKICKVDAEILKKVPYDYMVFRLDSTCPSKAYRVRRHHDTEDDDNDNHALGNPWPSVISEDANLEFCFIPATSGATNDFPIPSAIENDYAVFGNFTAGYIRTTSWWIDDENHNNENSFYYYGEENTVLPERVAQIMPEINHDTFYNVIRKLAPLNRKTSVAEADIPIVADDYAAVNKSATTEVRGLNHTTVSFELKSAGVADITIANAKGAVVSRISKEYLNPGVHSAEWHSGVLPNGLYIVTVKHNGTVSSKTFALK